MNEAWAAKSPERLGDEAMLPMWDGVRLTRYEPGKQGVAGVIELRVRASATSDGRNPFFGPMR